MQTNNKAMFRMDVLGCGHKDLDRKGRKRMMTLDEAIKHCEEVASCKNDDCGAEHKQLAEWLKKLKEYREEENILKIGTIVCNHWAGENNPSRYFIYAGTSGKYANGISYYGGKLNKEQYYAKDLKDKIMFEPVGYCNAFDAMKADLQKLLN